MSIGRFRYGTSIILDSKMAGGYRGSWVINFKCSQASAVLWTKSILN